MRKSETEVHEGHRERMKKRAMEEGLESFASHEVLEFLLFFGIARKNVNPLAHELIMRFGSLSGVFEADPADLAAVKGMSQHAALLISSIPQITRVLARDALRERPALENWRDAGEYALKLYAGRSYETFMMICLDGKKRVTACPVVSEGSLEESPVYLRRVVETVLRNKATHVVMVHNHPAGTPRFSHADIVATNIIRMAFASIEINLIDHLLIADGRYVSMSHEHILDEMKEYILGRKHAVIEGEEWPRERESRVAEHPAPVRSGPSHAFREEGAVDLWAHQIIEDQESEGGGSRGEEGGKRS